MFIGVTPATTDIEQAPNGGKKLANASSAHAHASSSKLKPSLKKIQHSASFIKYTQGRAAERRGQKQRLAGLLIALVSVTTISFDGSMVSTALTNGASPAAVMTYQGLFGTGGMCIMLLVLRKVFDENARKQPGLQLPKMPTTLTGWGHVLLVAAFTAFVNVCYAMGFFFTQVANVLAFAILAPVWASLLAKPVLGATLRYRTMAAIVGALGGGLVLCWGAGLRFDGPPPEGAEVYGLLFALGTGLGNACMFTAVDSAARHAPEVDMLLGTALGFVLQTCLGIALDSTVLGGPAYELSLWGMRGLALHILVVDGVALSFALSASNIAAQLATPAEVSITYQFEGLFGATFSYFILGETVSLLTGLGGATIFSVVITHELVVYREQRVALPKLEQPDANTMQLVRRHSGLPPGVAN